MPLHPEGTFMGTVADCGFTEPTDDRPQQIFIRLESEDGDHVTAWLSLSDAARKWTVKKLQACGWGGDEEDIERGNLKGAKVSYVVEHSQRDGKTRAQVGWINKPRGVRKGEVTTESRARLAAALAELGDDDDDTPF